MWLYDNFDRRGGRWNAIVSIFNVFLVVLGLYLMISGVSPPLSSLSLFACRMAMLIRRQTWGAVQDITDSYNEEGGSSPWSCADNSNSS